MATVATFTRIALDTSSARLLHEASYQGFDQHVARQLKVCGWLGGLADPRIARSLKALHDDPIRPWSITSLAAIAGMSRSNFCDNFAALVGRAPLRYRNDIRLNLARHMLTEPGARVGDIGMRVGYESEAAFSRAYKAHFGRPPSADVRARLVN